MSKKIAVGLPEVCYAFLPSSPDSGEVVLLKRGVQGYYPTEYRGGETKAMELNNALGVTLGQMRAMEAGAMFGFHVKAADPARYDKDGDLVIA